MEGPPSSEGGCGGGFQGLQRTQRRPLLLPEVPPAWRRGPGSDDPKDVQ